MLTAEERRNFWGANEYPHEPSAGCRKWLPLILERCERDHPDFNEELVGCGYEAEAEKYDCYLWEYFNVLTAAEHWAYHARPKFRHRGIASTEIVEDDNRIFRYNNTPITGIREWLVKHGLRVEWVSVVG